MALADTQRLGLDHRGLHLDAIVHLVARRHLQRRPRGALLALEADAVLAELTGHPLPVEQVPAVLHPPRSVGGAAALKLRQLVHRVVPVGVDVLISRVLGVDRLAPLARLLLVEHPYHVIAAGPHVKLALAGAVQGLVHVRHEPHELVAPLQHVPEQRVVPGVAIHVRARDPRLPRDVPPEAEQSVVVEAEDSVVVVVDEEPPVAVLGHEHGVLHGLVHAAKAHQVNVVRRHLIRVEVLLPLGVELALVALAGVQPHVQPLQRLRVCVAVGIAALEGFVPVVVEAGWVSGEQAVGVAGVQLLPALHPRVVEAGDAAEPEHALRGLVVVEVVLAHEDERVLLRLVVEHHDREPVDGRAHVMPVAAVYRRLLRLGAPHVPRGAVHAHLHVRQGVVPQPRHARVVRAR